MSIVFDLFTIRLAISFLVRTSSKVILDSIRLCKPYWLSLFFQLWNYHILWTFQEIDRSTSLPSKVKKYYFQKSQDLRTFHIEVNHFSSLIRATNVVSFQKLQMANDIATTILGFRLFSTWPYILTHVKHL